MSKPTSYDLLLEINKGMNRLEDKLDARIQNNTQKIDIIENKLDNLLGKIGIGVMIFSTFTAGIFSLIFDFFRKKT